MIVKQNSLPNEKMSRFLVFLTNLFTFQLISIIIVENIVNPFTCIYI